MQPLVVYSAESHVAGLPQVADIILAATRLVSVLSAEQLSITAADETRALALRLKALQRELELLDQMRRAAADPPDLPAPAKHTHVPIY